MVTKLGRVVLGVLSAIAVLGGGALVVMVIVYFGLFGASEYRPELTEFGGWAIIAGPLALAVYTAGALDAPPAIRVSAAIGLMFAAFFATLLISYVVSLTADRGGPRGNLEDGTAGLLWLLAGAYFLWRLAARRWPVSDPSRPAARSDRG
ncbi:hypothetical protein [Amycolatopsis sp. 195334CR]|uniref:hypothetical protein n=1 Tax=Amycolatopsis sp. 195334CR TaxID=2814588 RepID=UPI001A8FA583|nr:hypothetical protein [Amycolatopsis sp. 195334CR]MBN6033631.1 hypothetical protein [Amycolatopsis sp. 195334CR]